MIRCIAMDDEPLALAQIISYIEKVPFLELAGSCRDAFSAMEILNKEKIDLIYVDINMPDLNGLDFVKSLVTKPIIIFTTAYSEYALEGFRVDAVDYILKPFSYKEFLHSANKALKQYELLKATSSAQQSDSAQKEFLFVKTGYKTVKVRFSDIKYIESQNEYVKIHIQNEEPIMTLLSLKAMEERLPQNQFLRVHRSFVVNINLIKGISHAGIFFDSKSTIPIGEQYREKINEFINQHTLRT